MCKRASIHTHNTFWSTDLTYWRITHSLLMRFIKYIKGKSLGAEILTAWHYLKLYQNYGPCAPKRPSANAPDASRAPRVLCALRPTRPAPYAPLALRAQYAPRAKRASRHTRLAPYAPRAIRAWFLGAYKIWILNLESKGLGNRGVHRTRNYPIFCKRCGLKTKTGIKFSMSFFWCSSLLTET